MSTKLEENEGRKPRLFPECGCKSAAHCIPCPHCGQCINHVEQCDCDSVPPEVDAMFGYDPHVEVPGG